MAETSRFSAQPSRFTLLASVAAISLCASPVHAQHNRVTACDVLTAHPDDSRRVSEPVPITERDPTRAIPACEEAVRADPNNARLRYQLGLAYDTARRFTDSFAAYQQAAQAGYVAAGHALAWAYANAEGTERNDAEAVRWYRWAAERGHTGSMNTLGFMLENGRGAPRDLIQAADWYRRAYDTDGRPIAAFNWARLLSGGRGGVPQDNARAVQLFRLAVQAGRADAALQLALMAERGEVPQVTPAELIQLLALAETGAAQRDRARRSINAQIAAGNGAAVDAARNAVAENIQAQRREAEAARQRREQALARVTQPAVAAAPGARVTAGTSAQPPGVSATPGASAQSAWLTTLWSNPVALAGAAGAIAVLLAGLGFWLGNRRGRQAAASVRQEPSVVPVPHMAAVAERSATMAPPAVAVSPPAAVPSSMDTSAKVVAGATQSAPVVRDANQPDTLSIIQHDKQIPAQDPEQASKAWLAEAEARRAKAVQAWETRSQGSQQSSASAPHSATEHVALTGEDIGCSSNITTLDTYGSANTPHKNSSGLSTTIGEKWKNISGITKLAIAVGTSAATMIAIAAIQRSSNQSDPISGSAPNTVIAAPLQAQQRAERQAFVERLRALNGRCLDFQQEWIIHTHMPQPGAQDARNSHPSRGQCAYMVHESGIVAKANDLMKRMSAAAGLREVGGGYVEFIPYRRMEGLVFGAPALVDFRNMNVRLPQAPCIVGSSHRQENSVSFFLSHLVVCINSSSIEFYDYLAIGMSFETADRRRGCQTIPFMRQYCTDTFDVGVRIYTVRGL